MAESPEEPRLSGLARSIDALFSATPKAAAPPPPRSAAPMPVTPEVAQEDPFELGGETLVERSAPPEDPRPLAPHMFPQSQTLEAIPPSPPAWAAVDTGGVEPPSTAALDVVSAAELPLALEVFDESVIDFSTPASSVQAPEPSATTDEKALQEAIDAYVDGDRQARDRIEAVANRLKDRLALDPLADGVQKLVFAAGDPPDRHLIEVANTVMNPAVASRLVQRMGRERDEKVRAGYMGLCRRLGRVMANALKGALTGATEPTVRRVYHETLISMGDVSRPIIEGMVEDENRFLVRDAVVMLSEIGGPRAVELVTSALADTDPRVRVEALHALAKLGDAEAGRLTLGFLDDEDSNVRLAAAVAAARLGLERALRPLLHMLEEEKDSKKRVLLLQALGELGDPGAVPAIEKHAVPSRFTKVDTEVRVAAFRALQQIGTPHARTVAQRAASDKDPSVRAALRARAGDAAAR